MSKVNKGVQQTRDERTRAIKKDLENGMRWVDIAKKYNVSPGSARRSVKRLSQTQDQTNARI